MRHLLLGTILATALIAPTAWARGATVTLHNDSAWAFHQLFVSPVGQDAWGQDQLGAHVIASGEQFQLQGIPCDNYDIKLVDEDGDECVIGGVPLCSDNNTWTVSNEDLLTCQVLTEE